LHAVGKEFDTYAKVIVNAAGPFCDSVRKMADKSARDLISPSSGVHIILPDYYSPEGMGLIVPKTKDGRVVFMLPWLGRTVAGTTDSNTSITFLPEPHEDEIQFILDAISDYLNVKVCHSCQYRQFLSSLTFLFFLMFFAEIKGFHANCMFGNVFDNPRQKKKIVNCILYLLAPLL